MANIFANLPVPDAPGTGASVLMAFFGPDKNIVLEGPGGAPTLTGANGILVIEVSEDGLTFAPFYTIDLLQDPKIPPFSVVCAFMRVRRASGFGTVTVGVGGETTASNSYALLSVPASDIGVPTNVAAMGVRKTLTVVGSYVGDLVIEGSVDAGATFDPVLTCNTHNSATYVFDGAFQFVRVRRVGSFQGIPTIAIGGHPQGGAAGGGVNSCLLAWSGGHEIPGGNGQVPDPCIRYFANDGYWYSETLWGYSVPAAGSITGLRVTVRYNDCNGTTTAFLLNGIVPTAQAVTIPPGITGTFITGGAAAAYAINDTVSMVLSTASDNGNHFIYFTATALYSIT